MNVLKATATAGALAGLVFAAEFAQARSAQGNYGANVQSVDYEKGELEKAGKHVEAFNK